MTETRTLGEELDRLDRRATELTEKLATADAETHGAQMLQKTANKIDQQGAGVAYLIDKYGEDATVTVKELGAGEIAEVDDRVDKKRALESTSANLENYRRNVYAAKGLVNAPFIDEDDDWEERIDAVGSTKGIGIALWLENLVNGVTSYDSGNWTPLSERLKGTLSD